jgi:hypothetical protein
MGIQNQFVPLINKLADEASAYKPEESPRATMRGLFGLDDDSAPDENGG